MNNLKHKLALEYAAEYISYAKCNGCQMEERCRMLRAMIDDDLCVTVEATLRKMLEEYR